MSLYLLQVTTPTSTTKHPVIEEQEGGSTKEMVVKVSDVTARRLQLDIEISENSALRGSACLKQG